MNENSEYKKSEGGSRSSEVQMRMALHEIIRLVEDVKRIRNHPLVPKSIPVYGYLYDVKTGKLKEISEATTVGRAVA